MSPGYLHKDFYLLVCFGRSAGVIDFFSNDMVLVGIHFAVISGIDALILSGFRGYEISTFI